MLTWHTGPVDPRILPDRSVLFCRKRAGDVIEKDGPLLAIIEGLSESERVEPLTAKLEEEIRAGLAQAADEVEEAERELRRRGVVERRWMDVSMTRYTEPAEQGPAQVTLDFGEAAE